jgi:hypothetical protein
VKWLFQFHLDPSALRLRAQYVVSQPNNISLSRLRIQRETGLAIDRVGGRRHLR